jgi:hypothetical protein
MLSRTVEPTWSTRSDINMEGNDEDALALFEKVLNAALHEFEPRLRQSLELLEILRKFLACALRTPSRNRSQFEPWLRAVFYSKDILVPLVVCSTK